MRSTPTVKGVLLAGAAAALVLAGAGGASAHVSVTSTDAKPGGSNATLVFKVENEEADAATNKVEITFPAELSPSGATVQAPAGWTGAVSGDKVVLSGGKITGTDTTAFSVAVSKLPDTDKLVFKTVQTYDNGDVARWIEVAAEGAAEPGHPAPILDLKNPTVEHDDDHDHAGGSADEHGGGGKHSDSSTPTHVHAGTGGQAADGTATGLPLAGPALVLLGLGAAGLGARRLARR